MTSESTSQNTSSLPAAEEGKAPSTLRRGLYGLDKVCGSFRKRGRRGASTVEFAIVAPVFLFLVFGMIEYGRMVMVQQIITNAAREGARSAVLDGATATAVKQTVVDYATNASITLNTSDVTLDPADPSTAAFGDPVEVTVTLPFSQVSWLPSPMYLGGKNLTASTVMRRESVE